MNEMDEKLKVLSEQLEAGVKAVFAGDKYRDYLDTMSKFHRYSFRNSMLIFLQNPHATYVAGFNAWKSMERSVNKGEKGLQILAPVPYQKTVTVSRDKAGKLLPEPQQKEVTVTAFRPTHVFDVSQTQGKELPRLVTQLMGMVQNYDKLMRSLCAASPCPIQFQGALKGNANGCYAPDKNLITIKMCMSEEQTIKTTIHEIAHAKFNHGIATDRQMGEVQAESVAYIVCQRFGIDSSQYSFGYVANWSNDKDTTVLKACLTSIQEVAKDIIEGVELAMVREQKIELEAVKEATAMLPEARERYITDVECMWDFDDYRSRVPYAGALYDELKRQQLKKNIAQVQGKKQSPQEPANEDGYKLFYSGLDGQDKEAHAFQKETGWNMAWGSDNSGFNGDTWIAYRDIKDLPKRFQNIVPKLQHEVKNTTPEQQLEQENKKLQPSKPKKQGVLDKLEAAKQQVAERTAVAPPQEHTQNRSSGHSR